MAFLMTRVQVGDYDAWKPMFDADPPGARSTAKGHRVFRLVDDPDEVLVLVEFDSTHEAQAAHDKLLASGVLDRVTVTGRPAVVTEADASSY
jgi:hypothetical protein